MFINWADLGSVFGATVVAAVGLVTLFSLGIVGLSRQAEAKAAGGTGQGPYVGAIVCFALCIAIVGYGIYLVAK